MQYLLAQGCLVWYPQGLAALHRIFCTDTAQPPPPIEKGDGVEQRFLLIYESCVWEKKRTELKNHHLSNLKNQQQIVKIISN